MQHLATDLSLHCRRSLLQCSTLPLCPILPHKLPPMIFQDPIAMQHLATVTNVTEATIRVTYRDMVAHLSEILGPQLATPENIAKLQ